MAQYTPTDHYWIVGDHNPTTQVYSSKIFAYVANTSVDFLAFLQNGRFGFEIPITNATNNAGLVRLTLPTTASFLDGQRWAVRDASNNITVWQVDVINATRMDLLASTFTTDVYGGGDVQGATPIATEVELNAVLATIRTTVDEILVTLTDGTTVPLDVTAGNVFHLTAAGDRTILAPTVSPGLGRTQKIVIRHQASGANRTLTLTTGAGGFRFGSTITGLSTTLSGLTDYIGCIWNQAASRWDVVSYSKGF